MKTGFAAGIAKQFINSKLTLLLMLAFLAIGAYSTWLIPREEEPQINLPAIDLFFQSPGASPQEIENRIIIPLEKILTNIAGVEYVYATALPGQAAVSVLFYVGEDVEDSLVKLYAELDRHRDKLPQPMMKVRSINDVPMMTLTFWSENETIDDTHIKRIVQEIENELKQIPDVAQLEILGGLDRQIQVYLDKERMRKYGIDALSITNQIQAAHQKLPSGSFNKNDETILVETGNFLSNIEEIKKLVVGIHNGKAVYLSQVANVIDGQEERSHYVSIGFGDYNEKAASITRENLMAVSLSICKRSGADAMVLADQIMEKVSFLKTNLIPHDLNMTISRNYGQTASQKVNELLLHLVIAIVAVTFLVLLFLGWRGALVVFLSVPVTFGLTLFVYYLLGYTLNRITLFALVFVTGIVVDDSIIIAENIHRHLKMNKGTFLESALNAINEVGNPTILATFIVVASILPMIFVRGLMGPYMSPMPIGASMAMLFSLLVALVITPWLSFLLLKNEHKEDAPAYDLKNTFNYKFYNRLLRPMLESAWKRWSFLLLMLALLLGSCAMFYFQMVTVKMLPFDNKNEFQIILDMPEGTSVERTTAVANEMTTYLQKQKEVVNYQTYAGLHAPINFNGLVRHYDLRKAPNIADIQVNFVDKEHRSEQSHAIVKRLREGIQEIARRNNAAVKLVEVPPGPPVMSTLVAEIYGPDLKTQQHIAEQVKSIFSNTDNIVDVDWMVEEAQNKYHYQIDKEKAMIYGITSQQIAQTMNIALNGKAVAQLYQEDERAPVNIMLQLPEVDRSGIQELSKIPIRSASGKMVSLMEVATPQNKKEETSIYRKNQKRVIYVTAEVAGKLESPVYTIFEVEKKLKDIKLPAGFELEEYFTTQPFTEEQYALKWDGEWHITFEVFRDLGAAFGVALIVIYLLIVGWFQSFRTPFIMLIAVPLSLIGIIIGHWLLDAFFTATSMIGMIALAGIMVRNGVLLIDFIKIRMEEGLPIKEAVLESAAVRTIPILLTAGTVVLGAFVILFDPIFQGLAISLMAGSIVSTCLTLLIVPLVYHMIYKNA